MGPKACAVLSSRTADGIAARGQQIAVGWSTGPLP